MSDLPVAELELDQNKSGVDDDLACNGQSALKSGTVEAPTGPVCEKCQTPFKGKQEWCKRCGWYPRLRTQVELDPWDREDVAPVQPQSLLDVWMHLIPFWAWKLLAGVVVIAGISTAARFLLPVHGGIRFTWTIAQMVLGECTLMAAHIAAYIFAAMENDRINLLDIVLKPIAVWAPVFGELPATFWRVAMGTWGMAAVLCAFIVGGLADRDLMDWGGTPAKSNLMRAITDQAQQLAGDNQDGLENAIEDFAGKAELKNKPKDADQPPKPKMSIDCLIIGYEPVGKDDFSSLILASEVGGRLAFVGTVSPELPKEERDNLFKRMKSIEQPTPFVQTRATGTWLKPMLACRVGANSWSSSQKLVQPQFQQMLNDIPLSK
jgi:hypothetical protein